MKKIIIISLLLLCLSGLFVQAAEKNYIQVNSKKANIYYSPAVTSQAVVDPQQGDIFEVKGETAGWYAIAMISGQARYIKKELTLTINYQPKTPEEAIRKQIFKAYQTVEQGSKLGALQSTKENYLKYNDYKKLLDDRGKFRVVREYGYQLPDVDDVTAEGNEKYWW
jgi:hypothetical protein